MNDRTATPGPSFCQRLSELLQTRLDGEMLALPPELEAHRQACPECRAEYHAVAELQRGLGFMAAPGVPHDLTARIVAAVLADAGVVEHRRSAVRRLLPWLALAASLLLAIMATRPWSEQGPVGRFVAARFSGNETPPNVPPVEVARDQAVPASLSIRDSLEEAGAAVASLTRRTADEAVAPTRKLLSTPVPVASLSLVEDLPKAMEPAAQSWDEVRLGAASGLEPVANSARRAVSMLLREMPPMDRERKPDF